MTSILLSCVNYNTYDKLKEFILSVETAYLFSSKELKITILIGDNSEKFEHINLQISKEIEIIHINNKGNWGYIGGVTKALELSNIQISHSDYFAISNVDVTLDKTFFAELLAQNLNQTIGWIAPAIISEKEKRDRNPKILTRPSVKKMQLTKLMYQFPIIHILYEKFIYKYRNKKIPSENKSAYIYAGHGSFMLFSKAFAEKNINFEFPGFLFGEEIYFAELNINSGLKTHYTPNLIIHDFDHASTSKIQSKAYFKMNYDSIKILIQNFF